ncbi:hypothetical protein F3Y22_tig00111783pilonHSYRG00376 [Hibiscus syriacus]|uniref:Uncharacterized protein n=1 Tax=Hibiscus syriacus TaxID=106335 RepID=A0A6A2XCM3_HIBSY|nr:hypothetical protein F3Y22_tig00111783pilonHSYRG00376 [Hibiscus syriacus]
MGKCLTREDSSWADEDWGSLVSSTHRHGDDDKLPDGGNTREVGFRSNQVQVIFRFT